jgi:hypothetical protein
MLMVVGAQQDTKRQDTLSKTMAIFFMDISRKRLDEDTRILSFFAGE